MFAEFAPPKINLKCSALFLPHQVSLIVFIIAFSLGYGPIPWLMAGEVFSPKFKSVGSSTAITFNWILAFIVTETFGSMLTRMTEQGTFWFFSAVSAVGVLFAYFVVYETKGKTLNEIQEYFRGEVRSQTPV